MRGPWPSGLLHDTLGSPVSAWRQQRVKRPSPTPGVRPEPSRASSSDAVVHAVTGADAAHHRPCRRAECAAAAGASPGADVAGDWERRRWSRAFSRRGAASRAIAWRRRHGAPRSRPARPTLARKTAARFQSRRRVRAYGQYGVGNVVLSVREYGSAGYVPTDSKGSGTWYYRYGSTDESGTCLRIVRRREHANNRPAGDGRRAPQRAMVRQACSAQR
jgi:hypothetical protein